ncbi:MAG: DUF2802 domain-containing protein [Gammaproteobacteria bacterium]|nr:DUF2802 domain-containing protein [Gammaproteobacteria bacterium]MBU1603646.1 DUF2802 domain-containing protein [Gammaproteobacteria bacterium]MBU2435419.1 DUF2802 domain-containing protein [Gammaproteobacteria bacterium]MBU2449166.1 DUF2802 domain-containing protein [Gammaproteobacteria bacterium]
MTLGLREGVIGLIALVAAYMLFVLLRMFLLRNRPRVSAKVAPPPASMASPLENEPAGTDDRWAQASEELAGEALRSGLEQELAQLRDEVDAIRGELAALRADMQQELGHLRAGQTVSPIYGDAMQMAVSGYDPAAIAERCGIARAEAELVVALAKSQER